MWCMSFDAARGNVLLRSRRRVFTARSLSARQPARRPSQHIASLASFRSLVWGYWKESGRHNLPWRKTKDPYRILVSEVMLQQTQVMRVMEKYKEFLQAFPNVRALVRASLADVLRVWNGLGYNRRGKYLRGTAKVIVEKHGGQVPLLYSELVELPGVGDYTAKAVRVFAFNEQDVLIETNIRTALIHHFGVSLRLSHGRGVGISDSGILLVAAKVAQGQSAREWHWALMDYGAHLKRSGVRNNYRSAHYIRQSKFEGSLRQVRGATLRAIAHRGSIEKSNHSLIRANRRMVYQALASLARDGLVANQKGKWRIA